MIVSHRLILRSFEGARILAKVLGDKFGEDGFAFIVDEGAGFSEQYGSVFAIPAIAEKGYCDVKVEVATAGGHSSVPPPHTVSFSSCYGEISINNDRALAFCPPFWFTMRITLSILTL